MPKNQIKLGKIIGVEIGLNYSWFWIFGLITFLFAFYLLPSFDPNRSLIAYFVLAILGSVLFFASVLVHELTHTFVAKRNNLPVNRISLFLFGGVSNLTEEPKDPKVELKVAIAGPISSVVIGIVLLTLSNIYLRFFPPELSVLLIQYIGFINLLLAFFNMLPGFPLDGGRVLRGFLWLRYKNLIKATKIATNFGRWVAIALIGYGLLELLVAGLLNGLWLVLIGFFLYQAATYSYKQTIATEILKDTKVEEVMNEEYLNLDGEKTIKDLEQVSLKKHKNYFIVKEGKNITGLISTRVLTKIPKEKWGSKIKEVQTPLNNLPKIESDEKTNKVFQKFAEFRNLTALPVFKKNKFIGIISLNDINIFVKVKSTEF